MDTTLKITRRITGVNEYLQSVKEIIEREKEKKYLFYRGIPKSEYCLLPKVFRKSNNDVEYIEREVILDYKQYLPQTSPHYDFPKDIIKILTDMQHHGIPTRLLDWTMSPPIALYFACEKDFDTDGKVNILNSWKLWEKIIKDEKHPDKHDIHLQARALLAFYGIENIDKHIIPRIKKEYSYENGISEQFLKLPFPFVSSFCNDRIVNQKGCFTIHGINKTPLECQEINYIVATFVIEKKSKQSIINELSLLGIDDYSVFPDYEGMKKAFERKGSLFNLK